VPCIEQKEGVPSLEEKKMVRFEPEKKAKECAAVREK
jgi:hypothetical protein